MASTGKALTGKTVAFLVAPEGIEQVELTEPWKAVQEAGGTPRLVSTRAGTVQAFHHLDPGDTFDVDDTVDGRSAADYDALVLPGGVANPDFLRPSRPPSPSRSPSSTRASRSRPSATHRGPWWRPTSSAAVG